MTEKAEKGALIVVSAPSGCGKSTILKRLMERRENLRFSVSATTRAPRPGERDGVDYFFVSRAEFRQMILHDAFLEYAEYVGNFYGTPRAAVEAQLSKARDVYLDIEVQGAMQVKRNRPETLLIFVMPPSMEELERRLTGRGDVDPEIVRRRLTEAEREISMRGEFDFVVVNDAVDRAADEISDLIDCYKTKIKEAR